MASITSIHLRIRKQIEPNLHERSSSLECTLEKRMQSQKRVYHDKLNCPTEEREQRLREDIVT